MVDDLPDRILGYCIFIDAAQHKKNVSNIFINVNHEFNQAAHTLQSVSLILLEHVLVTNQMQLVFLQL